MARTEMEWPNGHGIKPCICKKCNRALSQSEVHVVFRSNGWGDMRTKGRVQCTLCGSEYKWDDTWW